MDPDLHVVPGILVNRYLPVGPLFLVVQLHLKHPEFQEFQWHLEDRKARLDQDLLSGPVALEDQDFLVVLLVQKDL